MRVVGILALIAIAPCVLAVLVMTLWLAVGGQAYHG